MKKDGVGGISWLARNALHPLEGLVEKKTFPPNLACSVYVSEEKKVLDRIHSVPL